MVLKRNIVQFNTSKSSNESIYYLAKMLYSEMKINKINFQKTRNA